MLRRRGRDEGAPLGWKAGFGAPAALERYGAGRPLVGYLTRDRLLVDGATVSLAGSVKPVLEAEIALHVARDLSPQPDGTLTGDQAMAAVGGVGVAIEVADLDVPPEDVERIVADNVYHRWVLLGPSLPVRNTDGLPAWVRRDGAEVARTDRPEALTGRVGDVLASMAGTLHACGAGIAAGEVVITGAVVPPMEVAPGESWTVGFDGLGELSVSFSA
jgi:2-keto-4-pentenoate hydratase